MADMGGDSDAEGGEFGEEWEKLRMARRLQELFKGRFIQRHALNLLNHHNWDLGQTLDFVFSATTGQLRQIIGEEEWREVGPNLQDNALRGEARNNRITAEIRQFACEKCDNMWWRKVPIRKMVSRCKMCRHKFDALDRSQEWGWATFECQCGNEFHGFGAMGKTQSQCYACRVHFCLPARINPPLRGQRRRARYRHSCTAPNCFNRSPPGPNVPIVNLCVHPLSLSRKVVEPSSPHVSTGSTVKTFLTQDELLPPFSPYEPSLVDIDEIP